jgi:C4-dicarboxylate-specific signal transduction histidine kinase
MAQEDTQAIRRGDVRASVETSDGIAGNDGAEDAAWIEPIREQVSVDLVQNAVDPVREEDDPRIELIGAPVRRGETSPVAAGYIVRTFNPDTVCTSH